MYDHYCKVLPYICCKVSPYNYCKISPHNYCKMSTYNYCEGLQMLEFCTIVLVDARIILCIYLCTIVIGHSDIIVVIVFLKPSQWSYYMPHIRIAIFQNLLNSRNLVIYLVILIDLVDLVNLVYLATWVIWINLMVLVNLVSLLYQEIWGECSNHAKIFLWI